MGVGDTAPAQLIKGEKNERDGESESAREKKREREGEGDMYVDEECSTNMKSPPSVLLRTLSLNVIFCSSVG